jgi:SAM-dependent methyltransferase
MEISVARGKRIARKIRDALSPPPRGVPQIPAACRSWATDGNEPTLAAPLSQVCTQQQMNEPEFAFWCDQARIEPKLHRKYWEFAYILQCLKVHGMLEPGRRGVGFGTGREPLAAVMAKHGVGVLATDLDIQRAASLGWVQTDQHAAALQDLNSEGICDPAAFAELVRFEFADMNAIPERYRGFDFCWSSCALEHLGSIDAGLAFIENSLRCVRPGGIAVHTTEYNCYSDDRTVDNDGTVLFRMQDLLALGKKLRAQGHQLSFNFNLGQGEVDRYFDVAPYRLDKHLKLELMRYVATSIGIVVRVA